MRVPDLQLGPHVGEQDSEDENLCVVLERAASVVTLCCFLEHLVDDVIVHRVVEVVPGTRAVEGGLPLPRVL